MESFRQGTLYHLSYRRSPWLRCFRARKVSLPIKRCLCAKLPSEGSESVCSRHDSHAGRWARLHRAAPNRAPRVGSAALEKPGFLPGRAARPAAHSPHCSLVLDLQTAPVMPDAPHSVFRSNCAAGVSVSWRRSPVAGIGGVSNGHAFSALTKGPWAGGGCGNQSRN